TALPLHLAALVEVILNERADGEIGDEIELFPKPVQLLLLAVVQDQFYERGVVAEVAHHVVEAGAQQATFVLGIVGKKAAALAYIERVRKNGAEPRERSLIPLALAPRNHQIRIVCARLGGERRRAIGSIASEARIFRNIRYLRRRIVLHAKGAAVEIAPVRSELAEFPVHQGLRSGAQSRHPG